MAVNSAKRPERTQLRFDFAGFLGGLCCLLPPGLPLDITPLPTSRKRFPLSHNDMRGQGLSARGHLKPHFFSILAISSRKRTNLLSIVGPAIKVVPASIPPTAALVNRGSRLEKSDSLSRSQATGDLTTVIGERSPCWILSISRITLWTISLHFFLDEPFTVSSSQLLFFAPPTQ
jgi:hypothetical protein